MKSFRLGSALLTVAIASMITSCSEELANNNDLQSTDKVSFSVDGWGDYADTRSEARESEAGRFVLRSADRADTLCVRVTVKDGIEGKTQAVAGEKATRGAMSTAVNSFGCLAYTQQGGKNHFYIPNEQYSNDGSGTYTCPNIYYWPGSQLTLDFYNYAPYNATGLILPENADSHSIEYNVPDAVADQQDLMLAVNTGIKGDNNAQVPLTFKHLLSAVKVKAGSQMPGGTIKSVSFKNLYSNGFLDMSSATPEWGYGSTYENTYTVEPNVAANPNVEIVGGNNTLLMLPQVMKPASLNPTILEVVINDGITDRVLDAELEGEWEMGKTYCYTLNITPEYNLEFVTQPENIDAHYVIVPIKIKSTDLKGKKYTVSSSDENVCKLRDHLVGANVEEAGYWPYEVSNPAEFKRYKSIEISTEGEVEIYAFFTENAGTSDRTVDLTLMGEGATSGTTLTLTQKCPVWNGNMGWEVFEEDPEKPYGFDWNRKVEIKFKSGFGRLWLNFLRLIGVYSNDVPGISWSTNIIGYATACTIDYSKAESLSQVFSTTDGHENTLHFVANTAANLISLETELTGYADTGYPKITGDMNQSTDYAALVCLKKNPCHVDKETQQDNVAYIPTFDNNMVKWYLPASGQFSGYPADMNGKSYWSSTSVQGNSHQAYMWNGSAAVLEARMTNHNVRAARVQN